MSELVSKLLAFARGATVPSPPSCSPSPWDSPWDFTVFLFFFFALAAFGEERRSDLRTVELGWNHVSGALDYEVAIKKEGGKPEGFVTTKNFWVGQVPCGVYELKARSYDRRNVPGVWKAFPKFVVPMREVERVRPRRGVLVQADHEVEASVAFEWQTVDQSVDYVLEVFDEKGGRVAFEKVSRNSAEIKLPVAHQYSWQVQSVNAGCPQSDISEAWALVLKGKKMDPPEIKRKDLEDSVEFSWSSRYGQNYALVLETYNEEAEAWEEVESKPGFEKRTFGVDSDYKSGQYKLRVSAQAPLRIESDFAEVVFDHVQKIRQDHLFDVSASYAPMVKAYSIQNPLINAKISAFFASSFQGAVEYSHKGRAGAYLEYQNAKRDLKFTDQLTNTADTIPLRYQSINLGTFRAFRLKRYFIDQIIDVGVQLSHQSISNITSEGTTITTSPTRVTSFAITMFPRVVYFNILVRGYFSAGFLLDSSPLSIENYSNIGVGAAFEKQHFKNMSSGVFYRFENMHYDFKDEARNTRSHIVQTQMFGLYLKAFFW
ncbi:MAG: hypothetical protein HYW48_08540 [Deltaproteobacteria bacterium]|nr:hypothetical protein [Deltaproteobacteria bacterium]